MSEPTKQELINDLQNLLWLYGEVSRDFYREKGSFPETAWTAHFPTFKAFVAAATGVQDTQKVEQEFHDDKWDISLPKTRIHTLEELLKQFEVDTTIWSVERFIVNSWEMGYKDPDGNAQTQPLYQVKATLSKRKEIVDAKNELESLKKQAESLALIPTPVIRTNRVSGNMLEIALFDAHFGKLAWHRETGGTDYDIRIAQKTFLEAVEQLLDRAKGYSFDSVLFVVGNDLLHSDNLAGQTTKGTTVDCDSRYQKTFEIVRETITKCIERFRQIAPVTVKMVQGNHDELSVWHLGDSLSCLFRNYDDVTIDNEPIQRKYHQWGVNGFMFIHGHTGKRADYPLLFATERPDIFGSTKYREVHTGHRHQTMTEEFHGVRVRIIPSLSPADSWHSSMTFLGQQRVGEAYVFNKTQGLLAQFYYNADANG
jgi:hypothetical protein